MALVKQDEELRAKRAAKNAVRQAAVRKEQLVKRVLRESGYLTPKSNATGIFYTLTLDRMRGFIKRNRLQGSVNLSLNKGPLLEQLTAVLNRTLAADPGHVWVRPASSEPHAPGSPRSSSTGQCGNGHGRVE